MLQQYRLNQFIEPQNNTERNNKIVFFISALTKGFLLIGTPIYYDESWA